VLGTFAQGIRHPAFHRFPRGIPGGLAPVFKWWPRIAKARTVGAPSLAATSIQSLMRLTPLAGTLASAVVKSLRTPVPLEAKAELEHMAL